MLQRPVEVECVEPVLGLDLVVNALVVHLGAQGYFCLFDSLQPHLFQFFGLLALKVDLQFESFNYSGSILSYRVFLVALLNYFLILEQHCFLFFLNV